MRILHPLRRLTGALAERLRGLRPSVSVPPRSRLASSPSDMRQLRDTLGWILTRNILPFWYPGALDLEEGGYRLHHDVAGRWKGRASKRLVTQARTMWFFSRLARSAYGTPAHAQAAAHGYRFLRDRMWDAESGGFYWEVDACGQRATVPDKRMVGQCFALSALSEYARAHGDPSAIELARRLFALWEAHAHDSEHGGYREVFERNWSLPAVRRHHDLHAPEIKSMNCHLHLMEALTSYHRLTADALARERLLELILVQSQTVVRKGLGACTDAHARDWTPLHGGSYDRASYGHDLENLWLVTDAVEAVGLPSSLMIDLCRTVFRYALRHGFDHERGGFFESGGLCAGADRRNKIWWVQAEGLVAALQLYRLCGEDLYLDCARRTLDWIVKYQADWQHGDWHAYVGQDGKAWGDKAGTWKSPYHNGRAMLQGLELLGGARAA